MCLRASQYKRPVLMRACMVLPGRREGRRRKLTDKCAVNPSGLPQVDPRFPESKLDFKSFPEPQVWLACLCVPQSNAGCRMGGGTVRRICRTTGHGGNSIR
eukprot:3941198-Rhodomonas_salina.4